MNNFNQFGIKVTSKNFIGDKIKISRLLGKEIVVYDWKVEESKVKAFHDRGAGKCLHLQISLNNEKHIVFTSSSGLLEAIKLVPADGFPFSTIIVDENDRYKFT